MLRSYTALERISLKEITVLSFMGALMLVMQLALSALPNIHLTALLIVLTAVLFGWRSLYSVAVFIMLEGIMWGFGPWWLCYWYIWPPLAAVAVLMRKARSPLLWALVTAIHGLAFGAMYCIPWIFISGWNEAVAMWISGLGFDLVHCGGNFVLTLLLFKPLCSLLERLR